LQTLPTRVDHVELHLDVDGLVARFQYLNCLVLEVIVELIGEVWREEIRHARHLTEQTGPASDQVVDFPFNELPIVILIGTDPVILGRSVLISIIFASLLVLVSILALVDDCELVFYDFHHSLCASTQIQPLHSLLAELPL